jgi:sulfide:quinone oxidoreductase
MAHIVIIGAGIGGMPAAYELREICPRSTASRWSTAVDYFQFVPSNPWIAVGWRTRDAVRLPIRPLLAAKRHWLHCQGCDTYRCGGQQADAGWR